MSPAPRRILLRFLLTCLHTLSCRPAGILSCSRNPVRGHTLLQLYMRKELTSIRKELVAVLCVVCVVCAPVAPAAGSTPS